jgi:hypothetical protein
MSERAEQLKKRSMQFALDGCRLINEESDETLGWLEFIDEARLMPSPIPGPLIQEAMELVAIFSATYGTARANQHE